MAALFGKLLLSSDACFSRTNLLSSCVKAKHVRRITIQPGDESSQQPDRAPARRRWITQVNDKMAQNEGRIPSSARFVYPEFLPNPYYKFRNSLAEKLERKDMIARRGKVIIPEFYTGTIMAVTTSNIHSPEKTSRFMGICIYKGGSGLRSRFILRNSINGEGFDVVYDMYSPLIQKFEIIKLEKRLDDNLLYLRDALLEYSTFPLDMIPERRPEGAQVPINPLQVVMKPRPWSAKWERFNLKGVKEYGLQPKYFRRAEKYAKPWEKYDLMKQYRETIPDEDQQEIFSEVYTILSGQEDAQERERRKILMKQKLQKKMKIG